MIQTFAWRLLRKSLPTRARAGKDSRCGIEENEVHCSLSAPFPGLLDLHTLGTSKLTHIFFLLLRPLYLLLIIWYFNGFFIAFRIQEHISIPTIIYCLLSTKHRHASIPNIFTSLWSMWKAGNDVVLCTKHSMPPHVHQARKIYLTTNLCRFLLNL